MGEAAAGDKTERSSFVNQEHKAQCALETEPQQYMPWELSQASSDDFLNLGNITLLQRVSRLDNILSTMEDTALKEPSNDSSRNLQVKHTSLTPSSLDKHCQPTESVLEEVEVKGSLVERVSELETRLMKQLQKHMTAPKSSDNVAYPGNEDVIASPHQIPPHDKAIPHNDEHEQSLQALIDVEKHEVPDVSSASLDHGQHHHERPFAYSDEPDTSPQNRESPPHIEGHQGMDLSETASMEEEDPRAHRQSKNKGRKIRKWLSKRFHIGPNTRQGKHTCSSGRCWSSRTNPKSCWNLRKGEPHASSAYIHYGHNPIDEDSS